MPRNGLSLRGSFRLRTSRPEVPGGHIARNGNVSLASGWIRSPLYLIWIRSPLYLIWATELPYAVRLTKVTTR
jgi:hypothetical protein